MCNADGVYEIATAMSAKAGSQAQAAAAVSARSSYFLCVRARIHDGLLYSHLRFGFYLAMRCAACSASGACCYIPIRFCGCNGICFWTKDGRRTDIIKSISIVSNTMLRWECSHVILNSRHHFGVVD